ncbi:quinoprotein glucose dehydrogenase [Chitinophaga silvatica]|uniref:Quinoprotein glucose dehydrogenase n=1 Tax=Chitinophaga silvatica TaxID=2282649 RepID=A0A3E1Y5R1_9BACT|nr:PQQ-dependent sugar dehydrogenase [Chitinophaga silvatica]RFS20052.1 quinoprotein glucose dehydrogenase [Chitinophaga silvatica]
MRKGIIGLSSLALVATVGCESKHAADQFRQPIEAVLELDSTKVGISTIISDLNVPWEITWGPDNQIWFTEQSGTISKVDPVTGVKKQLVNIPEVYRQRTLGLLGMAVSADPKQPYVFVDYTHMKEDSSIVSRLVRYTYTADTLKDPLTLLELPGNTGHNGSRVAISPDGKVFLSTGDAANGLNAPDTTSINGKTLRLNFDGSIPADNPYANSPVWSSGHRNIQGMVFTDKGHLFASEHGDAIEDEVNYIQRKHYYGWPFIEGPADLPAEKAHADSFAFTAPLRSWTPTIAPAGVDYYGSNQIPEWQNSILLGTLKAASLRVLSLNKAQDSILKENIYFAGKFGRLRDICVAPNGDIYIATSNRDWNPGKGFPLQHDDRILRLAAIHPGTNIPATAEVLKETLAVATTVNKGQSTYKSYCEACHKPDGKGVKGSFPSLDQSKLVNGKPDALIQTVLNGRSGSNIGEQMPAFAFLADDEVAELLTYIRNSWSNHADSISPAMVKANRK